MLGHGSQIIPIWVDSDIYQPVQQIPGRRAGPCGHSLRLVTPQPNCRLTEANITAEDCLAEGRRADYGTKRAFRCKCSVETVLINALAEHFPSADYEHKRQCFYCRVV
jgi:hypothetical protein